MYACTYVYMHACVYVCAWVCVCACVIVCVLVWAGVHTHTPIHTPSHDSKDGIHRLTIMGHPLQHVAGDNNKLSNYLRSGTYPLHYQHSHTCVCHHLPHMFP
jgi:hypothetical protein